MKTARQLKIYISHAQAVRRRYQLAGRPDRHQSKLERIEADLQRARRELAQLTK